MLDFTHVEDERLRRLVAFWLSARDDGPAPTVDKIDPMQFPFVLSNIWLCDVVDDDSRGRWRYRLVGEEVRRAHNRPMVGETLESITEASAMQRVTAYFAIATDWPAIVHVVGRIYSEAENPARGERVILPFTDAATGRVGQLLGATFHSWLERDFPTGGVPAAQIRTYTPVDGSPPKVDVYEA